MPPGGWSTTQREPSTLADSVFPSVQELSSSLCFHPPSAAASRLYPDRRRKVSGAVRCLPCPVQAASAYGQQGLAWAGHYSPWLRKAFPCPALALLAGQGGSGDTSHPDQQLGIGTHVPKPSTGLPSSPHPHEQGSEFPPTPSSKPSKPSAQRISWPGSGRWEENLANSHSCLLI